MTIYQVLVPMLGAILGLSIVFLIFLFLAPYRQRGEARKKRKLKHLSKGLTK